MVRVQLVRSAPLAYEPGDEVFVVLHLPAGRALGLGAFVGAYGRFVCWQAGTQRRLACPADVLSTLAAARDRLDELERLGMVEFGGDQGDGFPRTLLPTARGRYWLGRRRREAERKARRAAT